MSCWLFLFYFGLVFFFLMKIPIAFITTVFSFVRNFLLLRPKKRVKEKCSMSGLRPFSPLSSITRGQNFKKLKEILKCFQKQSAVSQSSNTITSLISLLIHQNIHLSQYVFAILSQQKFYKVVFNF